MKNEYQARWHKAMAITATLRKAGIPTGPDGVIVARTLTQQQWAMAAEAAGTKHPSDKTKVLIYEALEEAAQPITITTTRKRG